MKLRITLGEKAGLLLKEKDGLISYFKSDNIFIEGSQDLFDLCLKNNKRVIIAGELLGIRTSQDTIIPIEAALDQIKVVLEKNLIERYRDIILGEYVIIVIESNNTCKIIGDIYGQCDLYYQRKKDNTVFVSELSLLPDVPSRDGYDQAGIAHVLEIYGYRPPKCHTVYKSIYRLGIDEMVVVENNEVRFIRIPFKPLDTYSYSERELNKYADIFIDAIKIRSSRHGNVVYLSSGWDSTSILACLVHIYGPRKVRGVIGRIMIAERSGVVNQFEIDRAKAVAEYYGVHLDVVDFDYRYVIPEFFNYFRSMAHSNQIFALNYVTNSILAQHVSKTSNGDESVFAGEISDGVHNLGFSQFTTIFHRTMEFREYSDKMASYLYGPTFLRLFLSEEYSNDPIYQLFKNRLKDAIFDKPSQGGNEERIKQLLSSFFLRGTRFPLWSLKNCKLLTNYGINNYVQEMESVYLEEICKNVLPENIYSWYLHLYNSFHWQSSTVKTMTLTANENKLKMHLPFWDIRIQELLATMPENFGRGLDLHPTKYPLKWMLKNKIDYPLHLQTGPHSYIYDVNPTFWQPVELMYHSSFSDSIKQELKKHKYKEILSPEMFNIRHIDEMVERYVSNKETCGVELNELTALGIMSLIGWY